jgi:hypothetical protein
VRPKAGDLIAAKLLELIGPYQQGRAGLRLQHTLPNARIVYVSATDATSIYNLAYAQRLGL